MSAGQETARERSGRERSGRERSGRERSGRVRPAAAADASDLARIDSRVNPGAWSEAQFEAACRPDSGNTEQTLVLATAEVAQGFVIYSRVVDEGCIHNIAVRPSLQQQGLGQVLLSAALARMKHEGVERCTLEVRASNAGALALYEKFAFQHDGVRKNYYPTADGREDALLMSKQL